MNGAPAPAQSARKSPSSSKAPDANADRKRKAESQPSSKPAPKASGYTSILRSKDHGDFICQPQFHNSLPTAPCGPYLKTIELLHPYQDFAKYRVSSLEKNYIWLPHFPPDVGIRLDLVDQESILNPDSVRPEDAIDQAELRLLKSEAVDTGRGKLQNTEKPWWLRQTTYLENNLYQISGTKATEDVSKRVRKNDEEAEELDALTICVQSFEKVVEAVHKLREESRKKSNVEVLWEVPILPGDDLETFFTIGKFDEDPDVTISLRNASSSSSSSSAAAGEQPDNASGLATRVAQSVLANIRKGSSTGDEVKLNANRFFVSLVAPAAEGESVEWYDVESSTIKKSAQKQLANAKTAKKSKPASSASQSVSDSLIGIADDEEDEETKTPGDASATSASAEGADTAMAVDGEEPVAAKEKESAAPAEVTADFETEAAAAAVTDKQQEQAKEQAQAKDQQDEEEEMDVVDTNKPPVAEEAEDEQVPEFTAKGTAYTWIRDYKMDVNNFPQDFIFSFDAPDSDSVNGAASSSSSAYATASASASASSSAQSLPTKITYRPVRSRLDFRKLKEGTRLDVFMMRQSSAITASTEAAAEGEGVGASEGDEQ